MKITLAFALSLLIATPLLAGDAGEHAAAVPPTRTGMVRKALANELRRYAHDARDMTFAPATWNSREWLHFAEGAGAVALLYSADRRIYDRVQANRSSFSDDFAKVVTPFGARRAEDLSVALIAAGVWSGNDNMRDAGRDSLESEILAGGIVTPLLKHVVGRARPIQNEGSDSFHPFSSEHQSFPSGHATNAFAFATSIAAHYDGWAVPTLVYSIATGVAMARVNDRAHFPSDVLAGALIGRAIARAVVHRHHHSGTAWTVAPSLMNGHPGLTVHITTR